MESGKSCLAKLGLATLALGASFLLYLKLRRTLLVKYVRVGQVSKILCYPVTDCAGLSEDSALCTSLGMSMLKFTDRELVVGKVSYPFATTQYHSTDLRNVEVFVDGKNLLLKCQDMPELKLAIQSNAGKMGCTLQCLNMEVDAVEIGGKKAGEWLSQCLKQEELRLFNCKYKWAEESKRFKGVGYLLVTESSTEEINEMFKFDPPLKPELFRPNIIISGTKPFDEKKWDYIYIGQHVAMEVRAFNYKLADDAYDVNNLEWRHEGEPRDAMDGALCLPCSFPIPEFEMYTTVFKEGQILVGDPVYVVYKPSFLSSL